MTTLFEPGTLFNQRYRIEDKIGEGGMGVVLLAWDERLERRVAIKVLPVFDKAERIARFAREAKAIARLSHPNIVGIHDADQADNRPYIVMEYLDGQDLSEVEFSSVGDLLLAVSQVCDALAHAHGQSVVHRDIKPENIILTRDGIVKVVDFGLALYEGSAKVTETGLIPGTFPYLAPELVQAGDPTAFSDQYATGVVLYYLLSGEYPHITDNMQQSLVLRVTRPARPLADFRPDLPTELAAVVDKSLERRADARYSSVGELKQALANALENEKTLLFSLPVGSTVDGAETPTSAESSRSPYWSAKTPVPPGAEASDDGHTETVERPIRRVDTPQISSEVWSPPESDTDPEIPRPLPGPESVLAPMATPRPSSVDTTEPIVPAPRRRGLRAILVVLMLVLGLSGGYLVARMLDQSDQQSKPLKNQTVDESNRPDMLTPAPQPVVRVEDLKLAPAPPIVKLTPPAPVVDVKSPQSPGVRLVKPYRQPVVKPPVPLKPRPPSDPVHLRPAPQPTPLRKLVKRVRKPRLPRTRKPQKKSRLLTAKKPPKRTPPPTPRPRYGKLPLHPLPYDLAKKWFLKAADAAKVGDCKNAFKYYWKAYKNQPQWRFVALRFQKSCHRIRWSLDSSKAYTRGDCKEALRLQKLIHPTNLAKAQKYHERCMYRKNRGYRRRRP